MYVLYLTKHRVYSFFANRCPICIDDFRASTPNLDRVVIWYQNFPTCIWVISNAAMHVNELIAIADDDNNDYDTNDTKRYLCK